MESTHEMNTTTKEILHDLTPLLLVYKDGRVERFVDPNRVAWVPPGLDPTTGVESKDVPIFPDRGVSIRIYKPSCSIDPDQKKLLPVLVYFHGGGFCIESTFSSLYHPYLNSVASSARTLIVSVEYRLAPEYPLPAGFDDCWDALNWVFSHADVDFSKKEPWIQEHADLSRVYMGGDSAGGSITHHLAMRIGLQGLPLPGASVTGIILFQPGFWGEDRIGDEVAKLNQEPNPDMPNKLWKIMWPGCKDLDEPWINPACDPNLSKLGSKRVLIFVAEMDFLRDRGWLYKEVLEKSGWEGEVELMESKGEKHVFHLFNPVCQNAEDVMAKVVQFINPG